MGHPAARHLNPEHATQGRISSPATVRRGIADVIHQTQLKKRSQFLSTQTTYTMTEAQNSEITIAREIYRVKREIEQCDLFSKQQADGWASTRNVLARISDVTTHAAANGGILALAAGLARVDAVKPLLGATCLAATIPLLIATMTRDDESARMHAWFKDRVNATSAKVRSLEERLARTRHDKAVSTEMIRGFHAEAERCHADLVEAASLFKSFPMAKVFAD